MLSRNLKRALLDSRWPMPPTFLLPWAANLTTISHSTESANVPPPLIESAQHVSTDRQAMQKDAAKRLKAAATKMHQPPKPPAAQLPSPSSAPVALSQSVRDLLPLLQAQSPHYITAHIYDRPYLLTQGDTLRLPFYMKGVEIGDVIRLNCASNIGSRDYTLKAAAAPPPLKSATTTTVAVVDPTSGSLASHSRVMPTEGASTGSKVMAPHFIPHIAKGKVSYLDERLFVCRAVVMGVESEPLRVVEKTKRRQRKIKRVKSKMRFTVLRIKEVRVRSLGELESDEAGAN